MPNGKKVTLKNILNPTTTPTGKPTKLKKIYDAAVCTKKGGKWVGGKCIPKGSTVRTGKKKYPSKSPKRSTIHYRPKIKE